jgi:hypothetical protein
MLTPEWWGEFYSYCIQELILPMSVSDEYEYPSTKNWEPFKANPKQKMKDFLKK